MSVLCGCNFKPAEGAGDGVSQEAGSVEAVDWGATLILSDALFLREAYRRTWEQLELRLTQRQAC